MQKNTLFSIPAISFSCSSKIITVLALLLLVVKAVAAPTLHTPPSAQQTILIIHSYTPGYIWTADMNQAIIDTFKEQAPSSLMRFEFMDTRNHFDSNYLSSLALLFANKYAHAQPDGIIATDDNALFFMRTYGADLFPGVPVVATGINNANAPEPFSNIRSIIAEKADHLSTLQQAIALFPNLRTVHVIADSSKASESVLEEIQIVAEQLPKHIDVQYTTALTLEELKAFASARKPDEIIYLLPHIKTIGGQYFRHRAVERALAKVSPVPIIVSWSIQMDTGVLGGRLLSPYSLGRQAAFALNTVLLGRPVIPLQNDAAIYSTVYDFNALREFGIDSKRLPANATLINRPESFIQQHFKALIPSAAIILVLSLILFLTYKNLQKQLVLQKNHQHIIKLDKEVIETQREIVATLGEVIEARSQETGGHVQRVASVSRFLGEQVGIDDDHLELLEAASPMHDVGKIGVPDAILNKPGKLTPEEFEIIKTHTTIGQEILNRSNRELLKIAADIAHQHHERWDGKGYPNGLRGKEISIYARITMLADVYDALSSERCYKKAWPEEKVLGYIASERAKAFDPELVDIFLGNIDTIRSIRNQYLEVPPLSTSVEQ